LLPPNAAALAELGLLSVPAGDLLETKAEAPPVAAVAKGRGRRKRPRRTQAEWRAEQAARKAATAARKADEKAAKAQAEQDLFALIEAERGVDRRLGRAAYESRLAASVSETGEGSSPRPFTRDWETFRSHNDEGQSQGASPVLGSPANWDHLAGVSVKKAAAELDEAGVQGHSRAIKFTAMRQRRNSVMAEAIQVLLDRGHYLEDQLPLSTLGPWKKKLGAGQPGGPRAAKQITHRQALEQWRGALIECGKVGLFLGHMPNRDCKGHAKAQTRCCRCPVCQRAQAREANKWRAKVGALARVSPYTKRRGVKLISVNLRPGASLVDDIGLVYRVRRSLWKLIKKDYADGEEPIWGVQALENPTEKAHNVHFHSLVYCDRIPRAKLQSWLRAFDCTVPGCKHPSDDRCAGCKKAKQACAHPDAGRIRCDGSWSVDIREIACRECEAEAADTGRSVDMTYCRHEWGKRRGRELSARKNSNAHAKKKGWNVKPLNRMSAVCEVAKYMSKPHEVKLRPSEFGRKESYEESRAWDDYYDARQREVERTLLFGIVMWARRRIEAYGSARKKLAVEDDEADDVEEREHGECPSCGEPLVVLGGWVTRGGWIKLLDAASAVRRWDRYCDDLDYERGLLYEPRAPDAGVVPSLPAPEAKRGPAQAGLFGGGASWQ
jgi:hypothetical protein